LHFDYPAQGQWKQRIVKDCMQRLGGLEVEVQWREDADLTLGYRTRAEFQHKGDAWGFFEARSHRVVDIAECPLCHPKLNAAFFRLRQTDAEGEVALTVNPEGDEVQVWTRDRSEALEATFDHVNYFRDERDRAKFMFDDVPIVNGVFSQSSLLLNRVLVEETHTRIGDVTTVLDLYCGNGNLSLGLDAEVVGIDHNEAAVSAADVVGSGIYRAGNELAMREAITDRHYDAILLDPPRAGAKNLVPALAQAECGAIVYVSCDPATLARDIKALGQSGWRIEMLSTVDMFPHTPHIESVCRLVRD
jgi:23S rRNA (uracil1939-C5)-methyltransferase